jgi:uncharacterized protein (TIGR04255 family)
MYAGREVFPNPPLELVVAEIRFSYVPTFARTEAHERFTRLLADLAPVAALDSIQTVTVGPDTSPTVENERQLRLLNRESTVAVALKPDRLGVETTDYPQFAGFRDLARRAVEATSTVHELPGVERIGLRYIDEIRIPAPVRTVRDWRGWIDERLLASADIYKDQPVAAQGVLQYRPDDRCRLTFRFGAASGPGVLARGTLRRRPRQRSGPYFLLDIDSFWQAGDETPQLSTDEILEVIERLHQPTGQIFASAITEKLRSEVLRLEGSDAE